MEAFIICSVVLLIGVLFTCYEQNKKINELRGSHDKLRSLERKLGNDVNHLIIDPINMEVGIFNCDYLLHSQINREKRKIKKDPNHKIIIYKRVKIIEADIPIKET